MIIRCFFRLALCGPGRSGKSEAAAWLRDNTCLQYTASTSQAATDIVYVQLGAKYGYRSTAECFTDRVNHRREWAEIIWRYNEPDGLTLYRGMAAENDILDGIRKADELEACREAGLVDLAVWIANTRAPSDRSLTFGADDCDLSICNNGTLGEYHVKLRRFSAALGILR